MNSESDSKSEIMGRLNIFLTFIMVLMVMAYSAVLTFDINLNKGESDLSVSEEFESGTIDCSTLDINNSGDIDLAEFEFVRKNLGAECFN